jgi:hypothetical protein
MSPVEICGMPYFSVMNAACVPLPAPGAAEKNHAHGENLEKTARYKRA